MAGLVSSYEDLVSVRTPGGSVGGFGGSEVPDSLYESWEGGHRYIPDMSFDEETEGSEYTSQMEALYYLLRGDNVMLCGAAGAGKSWVINKYLRMVNGFGERLKGEGRRFSAMMTASTGAAATLVFGKTIHSWSGLGISKEFYPQDFEHGNRSFKRAKTRIRDTDVLIIDEVSMLPAYFLTNLDKELKYVKRSEAPFGGIQIVLVGDFLQLPPVGGDEGETDSKGEPIDSGYCFKSPAFREAGFTYCYLDKVRRAKDPGLVDVLNGIRSQHITKGTIGLLKSRFHVKPTPGMTYTQLMTTNRSVDDYNLDRLEHLAGEEKTFQPKLGGQDRKKAVALAKNGRLAGRDGRPIPLRLKIGAVVMLTSNSAVEDKVNGSVGRVVAFKTIKTKVRAGDSQELDASTGEVKDPQYVTKTEIQPVVRFNDGSTEAVRWMEQTEEKMTPKKVIDKKGREAIVLEREIVASVRYVPLRLAWAITIHKSQGQTLDGAVIDLTNCFQKGLGYVALSRVRSLGDLVIDGQFPKDALRLDHDAEKADRRIRMYARKAREELLENERTHDADVAAAKRIPNARKREDTLEELGAKPTIGELLKDDATAYEWVSEYRVPGGAHHRRRRTTARRAVEQDGPSILTGLRPVQQGNTDADAADRG